MNDPGVQPLMEPPLSQPLPEVHLPVLREVYLAAQYAANLEALLKGGVDLLHQGQGVHQVVQFETGPGVRVEVFLVVLLEVDPSLQLEVDQEVRPGVVPVVTHGVVRAALREAVQ